MNQKLVKLKYRLTKSLHRHQVFVTSGIVLVVLLMVFVRINSLSEMPIDQVYLDRKVSDIKTVNFNKEAIKQIEALKDSDVAAPGTELPNDRKNPFSE